MNFYYSTIISAQVKEYANNNALCVKLAERSTAIGSILKKYLGSSSSLDLPCLPRVKSVLQRTFQFIEKFQETGNLSKFLFAGAYKDEFLTLNSDLTEALGDINVALAAEMHSLPVVAPVIVAQDVLARFDNDRLYMFEAGIG